MSRELEIATRWGVAREIGEDGLGSGEGSLGEDDPRGAAQRRKRGVEGAPFGEWGEVAEEGEAAGLVQGCEPFKEEAAEQARQHAHGQEEAGPAGDPAPSVRRQAAAGNDNVDMRMVGEHRAPGVQHGGEADARTEMLRVGGDGGERLGGGPEQEVVDGGLVLERGRADRGRRDRYVMLSPHRMTRQRWHATCLLVARARHEVGN